MAPIARLARKESGGTIFLSMGASDRPTRLVQSGTIKNRMLEALRSWLPIARNDHPFLFEDLARKEGTLRGLRLRGFKNGPDA